MGRLKADEDLYALVFGESVLNDAVAIVLYKTFAFFLDRPVTVDAVLEAAYTFFWVFLGSMLIGVCGASPLMWTRRRFGVRFVRSHQGQAALDSSLGGVLGARCALNAWQIREP
jgi:NhaP-type Na+/H+ or K+/H+ antiporter